MRKEAAAEVQRYALHIADGAHTAAACKGPSAAAGRRARRQPTNTATRARGRHHGKERRARGSRQALPPPPRSTGAPAACPLFGSRLAVSGGKGSAQPGATEPRGRKEGRGQRRAHGPAVAACPLRWHGGTPGLRMLLCPPLPQSECPYPAPR